MVEGGIIPPMAWYPMTALKPRITSRETDDVCSGVGPIPDGAGRQQSWCWICARELARSSLVAPPGLLHPKTIATAGVCVVTRPTRRPKTRPSRFPVFGRGQHFPLRPSLHRQPPGRRLAAVTTPPPRRVGPIRLLSTMARGKSSAAGAAGAKVPAKESHPRGISLGQAKERGIKLGGCPPPPYHLKLCGTGPRSQTQDDTARRLHTDAFFFRLKRGGDPWWYGPWTDDENCALLARLEYFKTMSPTDFNWGLFASEFPTRVGYQCRNQYWKLAEDGVDMPLKLPKNTRKNKHKAGEAGQERGAAPAGGDPVAAAPADD